MSLNSHPGPNSSPLRHLALAALLALAVALAYWNSLTAPYLFDDITAVATNPSIRQIATALTPPTDGTTTTGRPMVNLSFAINYALGGTAVWGYHALNLAIHAAAALALFGLTRRTLNTPRLRHFVPAAAAPLAFATALLWALHPLQTESVTSIAQRTESLCGLFYLVTLYGFARGAASPRSRFWFTISVLACLAGMATKEVVVTAPVLVLLYDRTFAAGSFAAAWQQRRGFYGALAATWLLLAWQLLAGGGTRGEAGGLGLGVSWWAYLLKQSEAVLLYLKLSVWPHPLVVDYGGAVVRSWIEVWWQAPVVLALLAGTGWGLWRRPPLGFLGAWFFVILAPSSSVVPLITQTMAEHRMYLPLAAVIVAGVLGAYRLAGRPSLVALLVLAAIAGGLTIRRNLVYRSELALWADTVAHRPQNPRARTNLGIALTEAARIPEAVAQFEESLRLQPANAATHLNLCSALRRLDRAAAAVPHGEAAVQLDPDSADAHVNLAHALAQLGRTDEAVAHYEQARRLQPDASDVPAPLAAALLELGNRAITREDFTTAIAHYRQALDLVPDQLRARNNLANALLVSGHVDEAITHYEEVLRRDPGDRLVQENLALAREKQRANRQ